MGSLRELVESMRRKTDESLHGMVEVRTEIDTKMAAKEGQKLWANFRKYAQYDELRELYRKTMPEISKFEDKLKENNDHNNKLDLCIRRIDEVICTKTDRNTMKEFREYVDKQFITRVEN